MVEIIAKRRIGRPKATAVGLAERIERYRLGERCAEFTDEVIDFWAEVLTGKVQEPARNQYGVPMIDKVTKQPIMRDKYTTEHRMMASDRLMERAYGRPITVMDIDQKTRSQTLSKSVIEVRWLPPDPADTSKRIPPEAD